MTQKMLFYCVTLFSLFFLFGCSGPIDELKKSKEVKDLSKELVEFADQFQLSIVLSQKGCTACNKKIVDIIERHADKENFGTIIETTGRNYDISKILNMEQQHKIIKDYKSQLSKRLGAESSFFLYYPNGIEGNLVEKYEIEVNNMDTFENRLKDYLIK